MRSAASQSRVSTYSAASTARISHKRRASTRFQPWIIIAIVMAVGIVIAGLIITIIAYWPGQSSIGYNPMRIAGPCILGVGAAALIVIIIVAIYLNNLTHYRRQGIRENYRSRLNTMSRSQMMDSHNTLPQQDYNYDKYNQYNTQYGQPPNGNTYYDVNYPNYYSQQSYNQQGDAEHPVYKIETLPDPHASVLGNGDAELPAAMRPKSKKMGSHSSLEKGRNSPMAGMPDLGDRGSGYSSDASDSMQAPYGGGDYPQQPPVHNYDYPPQEEDYPEEKPKKKKKKSTATMDEEEEVAPLQTATRPTVAPKPKKKKSAGEIDPVTGEVKKKKKKKPKPSEDEEIEMAEGGPQRIHIHTKPGTQVQITPGYN